MDADVIYGPLKILAAVAVLFLVVMGFVNLVIPGMLMTASLGYSMCNDHTAYVDFVSLRNTHCSIVPGDSTIIAAVPPKVGDVVCVNTDVGIICHRAYQVDQNGVCIIGDAAKWTACYPWSSYVGKVVGKVPRAVAMPGMIVWGLTHGYWDIMSLVDAGSYAPAGV